MEKSGHPNGRASLLGSLLQARRTKAGLSLTELAARTGVSRIHLARLERGITQHPSLRVLAQIATEESLGLSAIDLYAAAGCLSANDLPEFRPYLCAMHPDWPETAIQEVEAFYKFVKDKHSREQD